MTEYIKQYIIEEAYSGNQRVNVYENGKKINSGIVADYEIDGYVSALESLGYELAYNIDACKKELQEAEKQLAIAKQVYEYALKHPLYKND